ncbi:unnamed protein product, partial [Choristocarpus tenellus]
HLVCNGLAGVLSSPANRPHLDGVLLSVLNGIANQEDATAKKSCLSIFALLLRGFNRLQAVTGPGGITTQSNGAVKPINPSGGREGHGGGMGKVQARARARGQGEWNGTDPTVDMDPGAQAGVTAFVLEKGVPAALRCLVVPGTRGLNLRDAVSVSAVNQMGILVLEARTASQGSVDFVGRGALASNCPPQVAKQLQQAVGLATDGPAIAAALKAYSKHMRPTS